MFHPATCTFYRARDDVVDDWFLLRELHVMRAMLKVIESWRVGCRCVGGSDRSAFEGTSRTTARGMKNGQQWRAKAGRHCAVWPRLTSAAICVPPPMFLRGAFAGVRRKVDG